MPIERSDIPDHVPFLPGHDAAAFEDARMALATVIAETIADPDWSRTGSHADNDPYDLAETTVVGWEHRPSGRTIGVETAPGRAILTVAVDPEATNAGCDVRIPRRWNEVEAPMPLAAAREALILLSAITARAMTWSRDDQAELEAWGRGIAAIVASETGRDVSSVAFPTPLSGPRGIVLGALRPDAPHVPRLIVMDREFADVEHPVVDALAMLAPTAYQVHASGRPGARREVQIHTHQFERTAARQVEDPVGEMRAIALVRAALDAGRPA